MRDPNVTNLLKIDIGSKLHVLGVNAENLEAASWVGDTNINFTVEPTEPTQSLKRIEESELQMRFQQILALKDVTQLYEIDIVHCSLHQLSINNLQGQCCWDGW